jgi:hypothetical protein
MEETPLEQLVDALASNRTGEVTRDPLEGLVTVTLARTEVAKMKQVERRTHNFVIGLPRLSDFLI